MPGACGKGLGRALRVSPFARGLIALFVFNAVASDVGNEGAAEAGGNLVGLLTAKTIGRDCAG